MAKVDLYDCILIHAGNKDHEIPKNGVTAREIALLRGMHGDESVPERYIKPRMKGGQQETRDVDPKIELFELARKYANTADPMSGKKVVEKVFGTALIGFDNWFSESVELENMEREEAMQQRQAEAAQRRKDAARQQQAAA